MKCIETGPYPLIWISSYHFSYTAERFEKEKDSSTAEITLYTRHPSFNPRMSGA